VAITSRSASAPGRRIDHDAAVRAHASLVRLARLDIGADLALVLALAGRGARRSTRRSASRRARRRARQVARCAQRKARRSRPNRARIDNGWSAPRGARQLRRVPPSGAGSYEAAAARRQDPPERLAQVAVLADRPDVTEELVRLEPPEQARGLVTGPARWAAFDFLVRRSGANQHDRRKSTLPRSARPSWRQGHCSRGPRAGRNVGERP
jgi:hypothetical protein